MQPTQSRPPPPDLLHKAFARLLHPLVRLAIRAGITFPTLADTIRSLYVDIAAQHLQPDGRPPTDSRVSLLTGVHRKQLRRQRRIEDPAEPPTLTLTSQVIGRWLGTPATTGPNGRPLPIPRLGPAPSFEALVTAVTRDIRPRALLDLLIDQGVALLDDEDRVRLQELAFIPQADRATQVFYFARNLHDHLAAAAANLLTAEAPPFLDRAVHYDNLSAQAADAIAAMAREAATRLLLDVNRRALAIADADTAQPGPGPRTHRVNLGAYLLRDHGP